MMMMMIAKACLIVKISETKACLIANHKKQKTKIQRTPSLFERERSCDLEREQKLNQEIQRRSFVTRTNDLATMMMIVKAGLMVGFWTENAQLVCLSVNLFV